MIMKIENLENGKYLQDIGPRTKLGAIVLRHPVRFQVSIRGAQKSLLESYNFLHDVKRKEKT